VQPAGTKQLAAVAAAAAAVHAGSQVTHASEIPKSQHTLQPQTRKFGHCATPDSREEVGAGSLLCRGPSWWDCLTYPITLWLLLWLCLLPVTQAVAPL
jgi:hypothetical protein